MRQLTVSPLLPGLVAAALSACGGSGGAWEGSVADSAGIPVVTNTGAGLWQPGDAWTVEEDLRIGMAEGEPAYQFGQIAGIDVGPDGRIYVMDQQASEVRVFSPQGEFLARMGRPGGGPGELGQAAGPVFVGSGDTVVVPDVAQQRVTRFTPAGEPAGSYMLSLAEGIPVKWMQGPDGQLVQQSMIMALPNQPTVEPKNLLLRRDRGGAVVDTILVMPAGQTMDFSTGQPRMTIFAPEPMWALAPDGRLIHGNNSVYRLEVYDPSGQLARVIRKDRDRKPVTEADVAEFRRVIRQAWQEAGMPPAAMDRMAQGLNFAEYYPAYANLFGGPDGTIWVQEVQSPESVQQEGATFGIQDIGGPDWEVFDADGRLLGTVSMPPRFTPLLFEGERIYGVLRDDLDVQYAVRMNVLRRDAAASE